MPPPQLPESKPKSKSKAKLKDKPLLIKTPEERYAENMENRALRAQATRERKIQKLAEKREAKKKVGLQ